MLVATMFVAAGALNGLVVKSTPTGQSANRNIWCAKSSSGSGLCIREDGSVNASGSYLTNGVAASGIGFSTAEGIYVNQKGDTMTGALVINITGGGRNTIGLNALNTVSGAVIHGEKSLTSSGTFVFEGAASGATLYLGGKLEGSGLVDCDLATQTVAWDATTGRFSCGTDADTTYTAGRGLGLNGTSLSLNLTITGSVIQAATSLASSGTLVIEGAMSGASLQATTLSGTFIKSRYAHSPASVMIEVFGSGSAVTTGSGKVSIPIPVTMSGFKLTDLYAEVGVAGVTNTTNIKLYNQSKAKRQFLTTQVTIDSAEVDTDTAATPFVINTAANDVGAKDIIEMYIPQVSTTAPKGLKVYLIFTRP